MSEQHSTNGTLRACAYYRKSTDEQEQSIPRQQNQVAYYTRSRGYQLVAEYKDEGIAGDVFDRRPGFQKMLQAAQRREFDVIVVDEPSRLSRQNPVELIEKVIAPLRRSSVKIDTASKGLLDYQSLAGLILLTVHAHKSEDESRDLSRRVLGGIARRALAGEWYGWLAPYGLRIVREVDPLTGKVLARRCVFGPEEEVRAVRFIFDAIANRGWSLRQVCRELEARGIKPPIGNGRGTNKAEGRWNATAIRNVIRNRKYAGDLKWNERRRGKYSFWLGGQDGQVEAHAGLNRQTTSNAGQDVVIVADVIPPLIDRDTFTRANVALQRAAGRTCPKREDGGYLFTHLLVCGDCGAYLLGRPAHGQRTYLCGQYKEYGSRACFRNAVREDQLTAALFGALRDVILSPRRLQEVEAEMHRRLEAERASGEADRIKYQVRQLDRDIAQGNANLARLPEDRLPGVVAQVRAWEKEREQLLARLHELATGEGVNKATLDKARQQLWRLRESLLEGDREAQAAVLREVVSKVEVRFTHEPARRVVRGKPCVNSKASGLVLYVRPGLGLSHLESPAWPAFGSPSPSSSCSC
jgi:site-specific DNA recombinase